MRDPDDKNSRATDSQPTGANDTPTPDDDKGDRPVEIGGRDGLEPTRYGDWEKAGRCIDF